MKINIRGSLTEKSILNSSSRDEQMMKTLQEKIAQEVIAELKQDSSIVGIQVCGSLARGEIRPDSDSILR